ncbi:MAG TPA: FAD-binding protein, partial [Clostridia bacterium]|nr:FAD-binding protein [Clostridia bacterium]
VVFEKNPDGSYNRIEGQGSSQERPIKTLMFHGPKLMEQLRKVCENKGIKIIDKVMVTDLLHEKNNRGAIRGALGFQLETGKMMTFTAKGVVLTTGAQGFKSHYAYLNMVTGDAHIMGLEAGAALANYEFCLHHLTHTEFETTGMNIVQGLNGVFVNGLGEDFTGKYDPEYKSHGNLWRLSSSMALEIHLGRGPIYIDFSTYSEEDCKLFSRTLPIMYRAFERAGYIKDGKIIKKRLEWVSAMSGNVGFGGGLWIDSNGQTTLEGLYAAGDASYGAASGVEGYTAYGMPFATFSGAIVGTAAAQYVLGIDSNPPMDDNEIAALAWKTTAPLHAERGVDPGHIIIAVQEALFPYEVYILRSEQKLQQALDRIMWLKENEVPYLKAFDSHYLRTCLEARNMVLCAEAFLRSALYRKESRGSHIRLDYPEIDNVNWLKWVLVTKKEDELILNTRDIPIDSYPMRPEEPTMLHPVFAAVKNNGEEI